MSRRRRQPTATSPADEPSTSFGDHLREWRKVAGLRSQASLAREAKLSGASFVSDIENGKSRDVTAIQNIISALYRKRRKSAAELRDLAYSFLIPPSIQQSARYPQMVGVIVPRIDVNAFWSRIVAEIQEYALTAGLMTVICQHKENPDALFRLLTFFEHAPGLCGLLIAPPSKLASRRISDMHHNIISAIANLRERTSPIPIVFFDRSMNIPHLTIPYVGIDNEGAAALVVDHLHALGHKHIAIMTARCSQPQDERLAGYKQALQRHNLPVEPRYIKIGVDVDTDALRYAELYKGNPRQIEGVRHGMELLQLKNRPSAIFCTTYYLALDALEAVRLHNEALTESERLVVPDNLSIVGFDDVPELNITTPKIGRIHYSLPKFASTMVETLLALREDIDDEETPQSVEFDRRELRFDSWGSVTQFSQS